MHDQLATGRKIGNLAIVDKCSRFSSGIDARIRGRAADIDATPEAVCS